MKKLSALLSDCRKVYPDDPTYPPDTWRLSFVCPICGPPGIVTVHIGPTRMESPRRWQWSCDPASPDFTDKVTLQPSINNTEQGHGSHRPRCSFHGNILNGYVVQG